MARLSNCGKSETGGLYGEPGDQTGAEYWNINYWANGWQYVFRHPSASVASLISLYAEHAADNDKIGYSQSGRETFWQQISFLSGTHDPAKITALCNADCSSSTMAIIRAVGIDKNVPKMAAANISWTTFDMVPGLEGLGFRKKEFTGEGMLKPGDILMTDGHACIVIGATPEECEGDYTEPGEAEPEQEPVKPPIIMKGRYPLLKRGIDPEAGRDAVISLEALLRRRNVAIASKHEEGVYDEALEQAIKNWQIYHNDTAANQITVDGEAGPEVFETLIGI